MKKEKVFNVLGLIVGLMLIIVGILVAKNPVDDYFVHSVDSVDYAKFNADYYTEQYAATRAAVRNTGITVNIIDQLGKKLTLYAGLTFFFSGILVSLCFTKKLVVGPAVAVYPFNAPVAPDKPKFNDELPDL